MDLGEREQGADGGHASAGAAGGRPIDAAARRNAERGGAGGVPLEAVDELLRLAGERVAIPSASAAEARGRRLLDHVTAFLVPRARSLDAPLLVLLVGPTGAGKSSLANTLAGAPLSETGVLRPTTREAVVLASPSDANALLAAGSLAGLAGVRVATGARGREGVVIVDAPDIDSIEASNRLLADRLVEAADLAVFVTSAVRYADAVPWDVLERIRARGLPLLVVVNRLPPDRADERTILDDVARLLAEAGLTAVVDVPVAVGGERSAASVPLIPVREGDLSADRSALDAQAVIPVSATLDALAASRERRRELAATALVGALRGVAPLAQDVADDLDHEAIDADALRRAAETSYADELRALIAELHAGGFLREQVLREWHDFVGADQVTQLFATGIGRVQGAVLSLFRGAPRAPVAAVREGTVQDLGSIVRVRAAEAARRAARRWSELPLGERMLAADASLWSASPEIGARVSGELEAWLGSIGDEVRAVGIRKRPLARGASIGVNAAVVGVMLAVFAHTAGVSGAEIGVATGGAYLNQKLLNAIFGEAVVIRLIEDARRRLDDLVRGAFDEDRSRFERLTPSGEVLREIAAGLRAVAVRFDRS